MQTPKIKIVLPGMKYLKLETVKYIHEFFGARSRKDCTLKAQLQLLTADPTSRHRGRPTSRKTQLYNDNKKKKRILSLALLGADIKAD
jgi:hypothetical protein